MAACTTCGTETAAGEMLITGSGPVCPSCHGKSEVELNERRAEIARRIDRGAENAFGDATFDGKKRKRAVLLFVGTLVLLLVLYGLKLARVMQ